MKKTLITLGLLCFALSANATTIHYSGGSSTVTAIESLDIGGTLYNVDFDNDVFGTFGGAEEFWSTEAEASLAVDAINALFTANGVYGLDNGGMPDCEGSPCYMVRFSPDNGVVAYSFGDWYNIGGIGYGSAFDPIATAWSVVVPIPAAVWLFGSALAGLGWMRRKQTV
jgi:hypothetical protein